MLKGAPRAATAAAPAKAAAVVENVVQAPTGFVAKTGQELQANRLAEAARLREQLIAANVAKPAGTTAPMLEHYAAMPQAPSTGTFHAALAPLGRISRGVLSHSVQSAVETGKPFFVHPETLANVPPREAAAFANAEAIAKAVVNERRGLVAQWKRNFDQQLMRNSGGVFVGEVATLTPGFEPLDQNALNHLVGKAKETMARVSGEPKLEAFTSFQDSLLDVLDHVRTYGSPGQKATAEAIVRSDELPRRLANLFLTLGRDGRS